MTFTFRADSVKSHTVDDNGRKKYVVRYIANTDSPSSDGPVSCRQQFDLAYPFGTTYFTYHNDVDESAVRTRAFAITPARKAGGGSHSRYYVDATFDSFGSRHCSEADFDGPPWEHPWHREVDGTKVMVPVLTDKDGNELMNTADEPYYPALEFPEKTPNIVLTGNLLNVNFFAWSEFEARGGAVNSSAIGQFPARTLRVGNLSASSAYWGTCQEYFQCRIELEANSDTWDVVIKQFGFRKKNGIGDYENLDTAVQQPLNSSGVPITSGSPASQTHKIHYEKDFSQIGFPMSLLTT